jgi:hypothetical protein
MACFMGTVGSLGGLEQKVLRARRCHSPLESRGDWVQSLIPFQTPAAEREALSPARMP